MTYRKPLANARGSDPSRDGHGAVALKYEMKFFSLAALFVPLAGYGQSTSPRPAFDVASVKLDANCQTGNGRPAISARNLNLPCVTLRGLIRLAYGDMLVGANLGSRRMEVVGGPSWLDSDNYDIAAKSQGDESTAQSVATMLQVLLEDRFKVKVHKEARDSSVYTLTVAKGGSKLRPAKEGSCTPLDLNDLSSTRPKPGEAAPRYCGLGGQIKMSGSLLVTDWYGVSMPELAGRMLAGNVDLPVVDRTELAGRFDVHIEFVRDNTMSRPIQLNGETRPELPSPPADPSGPSIFAALEEQLGLKLTRGKAPLDVILVDHAEKPTAN